MTLKRCAGGILLREGRILLGKRAADLEFYPGVWDIIGGHCLHDEEPEHTLMRELREEIDVEPIGFSKLGVLYESQPHLYGKQEYHIFLVTEWIGKGPAILGEEHSEIQWLPVEEAMNLELAHPEYPRLFKAIAR